MKEWIFLKLTLFGAVFLFLETATHAAVYEVGPSRTYSSLGSVPWESLQPGDDVRIHYRTNAYREKFVLCRQGTAEAPITISGVPGPNGELPLLDGNGATTRTALNYWGENRAVIKIGGASIPSDTMPRYIIVENLQVRSARPPFTFTDDSNTVQPYVNNAAPIWIEKGENITIRNCTLHDSGNGFFVSSSDTSLSTNILMEGCYIFDNGNTNSIYEHNIYTAALGMTFQFNRLGPLRPGCGGNNLKDRSAGLVVRYNWIEGGNRQLDLVDAEDTALLRGAPSYRATLVYGNVLFEPIADGNKQIVHYGGDSGNIAGYRKGTLHFYNNTVVSRRPDSTTLFRLTTNEEQADVRNNILYVTNAGNTLALSDSAGIFTLSHNWVKTNWRSSFSTFTGSITNNGTNLEVIGTPAFLNEGQDDFRLRTNSVAINAGGNLHPAMATVHPVSAQYVKHQQTKIRPLLGIIDIGAFEYSTPIQEWRSLCFGTNSTNLVIAGNAADPDSDGVRNLLEYAFNLHPLQPSSNGLPRMQLLSTNGVTFPVLTFTKLAGPAGILYVVQTSSNLLQWSDGCRYSDTTNLLAAGETVDIAALPANNRVIRIIPSSNESARFARVTVAEE